MFKYIQLSEQLKQVIEKNKQLKSVIYNRKKNSRNSSKDNSKALAVAYSNLSLVVNNVEIFEKALKTLNNKSESGQIKNKYLFYVMLAEYMNTGKLKGGGKIKKIFMNNLHLLPQKDKLRSKINKQVVNIRIRSPANNHQSAQQVEAYQKLSEYFNQNYIKSQLNPQVYFLTSQQYSALNNKQPNNHIRNIRDNSLVVIQSLSSALPAYLLFNGLNNANNQSKKFNIIDACSAPGNKTLQLCDYLGNRGKVYAFQKDTKRYQLLCRNLQKYSISNSNPICGDFLQTQPQEFKNIKLILLDPSCSGSGMLTNYTRDLKLNIQDDRISYTQFISSRYKKLAKVQKQRIKQLKQFQINLLLHAASFKPQRISYSTCSIYIQQNQGVVKEFLSKKGDQYMIKKVINFSELNQDVRNYLHEGIGKKYKNCIRVDPRTKQTDGFFVTIFTRKK